MSKDAKQKREVSKGVSLKIGNRIFPKGILQIVRFVARKSRFACLYMFLKHIFVLVFGTIPEHFSSALFIGAGRDECAMFGLLEPGLVPWFGCILACIACVCEVSNFG